MLQRRRLESWCIRKFRCSFTIQDPRASNRIAYFDQRTLLNGRYVCLSELRASARCHDVVRRIARLERARMPVRVVIMVSVAFVWHHGEFGQL
jgi:hypothetical protein